MPSRTTTVLGAAAVIALFSGASAYAAGQITSADIANHTIQIRDIKPGGLGYRNLSDYAKNKINSTTSYVVADGTNKFSGGGWADLKCPEGQQALSGGYNIKDEANLTAGTAIVASVPGHMDWNTNTPAEGSRDGWSFRVNKPNNLNPGEIDLYVVCAPAN